MRPMPVNMGGLGYIHVGTQAQLFVDDFVIERMVHLTQTVNQPTKDPANPVLRPDQPWEASNVWLHGNVLYDHEDSVFKMWYQTWRWPGHGRWGGPPNQQFICYAVSEEGVNWHKPALNLVPYEEYGTTNILLQNPDPDTCIFHRSVVKDYLDPDPARRYKMMVYVLSSQPQDEKRGIHISYSADGIHWTDYLDHRLPIDSGDTPSLFSDPRRGRWFISTKHHARMPSLTAAPGRRARGIAYSDDFAHWVHTVPILEPDVADPPDTEFYHMEILAIYDNLYIAGLGVYHADPNQDTMDIQLVTSRDGQCWQRTGGRAVFIPTGPPSSFDSHMIMELASNTLFVGDGIWIYYTGGNDRHYAQHDGAIGRAILRRDGFISIDAGDEPGYLITRPMTFEGSCLQINADARGGSITVGVQDLSGNAIPGFAAADCIAFDGDAIRHPVTWHNNVDISQLAGRITRLVFHMQRAKLYAFQFVH